VSLKFCHPLELPQTFQAHEISNNFLTSPNEHTVSKCKCWSCKFSACYPSSGYPLSLALPLLGASGCLVSFPSLTRLVSSSPLWLYYHFLLCQGQTYMACTNATDAGGLFWCATNVDENGVYVRHSKEYGYCAHGCPIHREGQILLDTRTLDLSMAATDKECPESQDCKQQDECPEFLKQKEVLKKLPKQRADYNSTLRRLRSKVCNKKRKGVCCSPKTRQR
jgi:hypothetical protein